MTEYYRLIAVLQAQLNLDSERVVGGELGGGLGDGGTAGLTLRRLAVWVVDPLERLKLMATLVAAAAQLKVGSGYGLRQILERTTVILLFLLCTLICTVDRRERGVLAFGMETLPVSMDRLQ